jgi:signal transduction histidine kinase
MLFEFIKKRSRHNECIEEVFFRTILLIALAGCCIALLIDLCVIDTFNFTVPLNFLLIQIILLSLYCLKRILFHYAAVLSLLLITLLITMRGHMYEDLHYVTIILLITLGFISALVTRGMTGKFLKAFIFISLLTIVFEDYRTTHFIAILRESIPYLISYFIVTVVSGLLKQRYECNQKRLSDMVALLNKKNLKINEQHKKLENSYEELASLNEAQEGIIRQKTERIIEKNKQLGEIAYANSHRLRGPLARILGLLYLMEMDPEKKEHYLAKVNEQANEMDDMISKMGILIESNIDS